MVPSARSLCPALLALFVLTACQREDDRGSSPRATSEPETQAPATSAPPTAPATSAEDDAALPTPASEEASREVEVALELFSSTQVRAAATLPGAFVPFEGFAEGIWHLPPEPLGLGKYDRTATFSLSVTCGGGCTPFELRDNLAAMVAAARERAEAPWHDSSDPQQAAIRASVEVLLDEVDAHRAVLVQRITFDQATRDAHPVHDATELLCLAVEPGEHWMVVGQARLEPSLSERWLAPTIEACRSVRSLGRVPTEHETRPPLTVTSPGDARLDFTALPETVWTPLMVDEGLGIPRSVQLDAPLSLDGVPISPRGAVYVHVHRTPPTLSQFELAADHAFDTPPAIGVPVTCQRHQRVSLTATGELSECHLASDLDFGPARLAAFGEVRLTAHGVASGILAEDARLDGVPCARARLLRLHEQHGGRLEECVLAEAHVFGSDALAVELAAGTQVTLDAKGRLVEARLEEAHTLQGQTLASRGLARFAPDSGALLGFTPYQ